MEIMIGCLYSLYDKYKEDFIKNSINLFVFIGLFVFCIVMLFQTFYNVHFGKYVIVDVDQFPLKKIPFAPDDVTLPHGYKNISLSRFGKTLFFECDLSEMDAKKYFFSNSVKPKFANKNKIEFYTPNYNKIVNCGKYVYVNRSIMNEGYYYKREENSTGKIIYFVYDTGNKRFYAHYRMW
jgi:hypothetical protein